MDSSLILSNVLNSPVLFFFTGMTAIALKADLEILNPISQLFAPRLLFTSDLKGAHALHKIDLTSNTAPATVGLAVAIYAFFSLRLKLDLYNAAKVSAAYGSMRAVTLVTASSVLSRVNVDCCGSVAAALALMESPASIVNLLLRVRVFAHRHDSQDLQETFDWDSGLRTSCLDGSVFLSMGRLLMGQVWPRPLGFHLTSPSVFQFIFN
ncbi:MAG: sodium-dependent bicarbonate transport family permease [Cyanobacteria bacterium J06633_23]